MKERRDTERPQHERGRTDGLDDAPPPEEPRRMRSRLRRYRGLLLGGAVLFMALIVIVALALRPEAPEAEGTALGPEAAETDTVSLGTGLAGVEADDEGDEGTAAPPVEHGRDIAGGEASYYGDELAGNPTASGETFDPTRMTAAHRTLPFGTRVRVTHLGNDRSVVVRINDRGPFAKRRVIDLSEEAARRLGMLGAGQARVRLQVIE